MKKLATILALLCCSALAHAQVAPWTTFTVDKAVVMRVPGQMKLVPDAAKYEPSVPANQVRGYRYTDANGAYILMRTERPGDKLYTDSNQDLYNKQMQGVLQTMHGTMSGQTMVEDGPYLWSIMRYTVPAKGTYYMGACVVHGVSYQFQYMPSKPVTQDQDAKIWAQFMDSVVSIK